MSNCKDCKFFKTDRRNICRRYPPTADDMAVHEDGWCGEYKSKIPYSNTALPEPKIVIVAKPEAKAKESVADKMKSKIRKAKKSKK